MLKWEDQILQFMRAGSKQLDFPPLSSYHRLIIHRLAQRFGLDHTAIDPGSSGHYLDPNANRCVPCLAHTPRSKPCRLKAHLQQQQTTGLSC